LFGHLAIFGPLLLLAHHHDRFCSLVGLSVFRKGKQKLYGDCDSALVANVVEAASNFFIEFHALLINM